MKIIVIFIDGLGVAEPTQSKNPLYYSTSGIFNTDTAELPAGGLLVPLDASMGIKGLPQSATGQTSLYTGLNAQNLIGKHLTGYPNETLRHVLREHSLFVVLNKKGFKCLFLNAFRPVFFSSPELFSNKGLSASSEMNRAAGLPFKTLRDIRKKKALYHDYTNQELIAKGFDVPIFGFRTAADIIGKQIKDYDFVLYEYFLTDKAGHSLNMDIARNELRKIDNLLLALIQAVDLKKTVLIVMSDHGNIEDMSTKTHTFHPAFMAIWGTRPRICLKSLIDVYPFVLEIMGVP